MAKFTGRKSSDFYFIGSKNYRETSGGIISGEWDYYYGSGTAVDVMKRNLSTQEMDERSDAILTTAIEQPSTEAPFVFKIYQVKSKPVRMPNITATYGNPYFVYAVDFCGIKSF